MDDKVLMAFEHEEVSEYMMLLFSYLLQNIIWMTFCKAGRWSYAELQYITLYRENVTLNLERTVGMYIIWRAMSIRNTLKCYFKGVSLTLQVTLKTRLYKLTGMFFWQSHKRTVYLSICNETYAH